MFSKMVRTSEFLITTLQLYSTEHSKQEEYKTHQWVESSSKPSDATTSLTGYNLDLNEWNQGTIAETDFFVALVSHRTIPVNSIHFVFDHNKLISKDIHSMSTIDLLWKNSGET